VSRAVLWVALVVLTVAVVALLVVITPCRRLPTHGVSPVPADPARDFTAAQITRVEAFHSAVRPPGLISFGLSLLVSLVVGLSPLGARIVKAVASPVGGGWGWRVLFGSIAITAIGWLITLPFDMWGEQVLRRYGLSTQDWGSWFGDAGKSYAISLVVVLITMYGVLALLRRTPDWWWAWAAVGGAVLVVVVSFAYPVVVEPLFNKFTPMHQGPLRTSLLRMAAEDGVPAKDVLVADASRRTTALNAYVSGFSATRRIVVYDTLLKSASDDEVRLIVAHELGHAKSKDVLWGTFAGAIGVAAFTCLLGLLLRWPRLLSWAGVDSLGDGTAVALLLAMVALVSFLTSPGQTLISRRIETRADVHSLNLTHDPATFVRMQARLSVTNLSDLDPPPLLFGLFATHPTGPQRIALARTWAELHHVAEPPSLVH
jgi:STE24 endopeptidase